MSRWMLCACLIGALSLCAVAPAWAIDPDKGVNAASVIEYPTALDQTTTNTISGTVAIFDLGEPDLRPVNLRYGFQVGALQLLADSYWQTDPKEFDHIEAKAKLRVLSLDEYRTYLAFGVLARYVDQKDKEPAVIDNKRYSLFGIVTTELYPFANWDAFLFNFYLDNRFADVGVKVPIYQFIRVVAEGDYHHALTETVEKASKADKNDDNDLNRWDSKLGIELEGDQNFYVQLYYATAGSRVRLQVGTGF